MKNYPLTIKIWLALSLVSLLLYLFFMIIFPLHVRNIFTTSLVDQPPPLKDHKPSIRNKIKATEREPLSHDPNIRQFTILEDGTVVPKQARKVLPATLLQIITEKAKSQQQPVQKYNFINGQMQLRYMIRKYEGDDLKFYQVSLQPRSDEDRIINSLWFKMMVFASIALIISWLASIFIARYLTRPLIQMAHHVKRIAGRDWHEPLQIENNDELGQLARSIESMRQQLVRQEEAQQTMLQNVSHELKTPVMIIRSYAQALRDGIYPKEDLAGSIQVIDEEGARLEKLVKQLLYLTKLEYLSMQDVEYSKLYLHELIENIVERMRYQRPEVKWELDLPPVDIQVDEEKWQVLIENILDNHLRYAASILQITLAVDNNKLIIRFWNDGLKIDHQVLEQLFKPFQKGRQGKFGLGLAIAQRIVKMYQGEINMYNEKNGVCSIVKIPVDKL